MNSTADAIAALKAQLEALDTGEDDDNSPTIKEGNKAVRYANAALRARAYASSFEVVCKECGVHVMRVERDSQHLALRDYCSTNCIDDALQRHREAAHHLATLATHIEVLADPARKSEHGKAWAAATSLIPTINKLPLDLLHPTPPGGMNDSGPTKQPTKES